MKKQWLLLIFWLSLMMPGSGAPTILNARNGFPAAVSKIRENSPATRARTRRLVREKLAASKAAGRFGDPCDESVPIVLDQTLNGTLTAADCLLPDESFIDFYAFQGRAGQAISISLDSVDYDTYLFLLDADGNVIEENDDGGPGANSRIPDFGGALTLPLTGAYFIGASSFDSQETGDYTVALNSSAACPATPLAFERSVSGALTGTDCVINVGGEFFFKDLYTFQGAAGQQISITMNSGAVDSHLILHTPSGAGRQENDDNNDRTSNARLPSGSGTLTLTQTGIYTIEAGTALSGETGNYTLLVRGAAIARPAFVRFDFDGDTKTDISIFRPGTGEWWRRRSSDGGNDVFRFGGGADSLVPADFTGDGLTDLAVWSGATGEWFVLRSEDGSFFSFPFGTSGDIPAPADYDGDGRTDTAVFRPSTATWFIRFASGLETRIVRFGISGDRPRPADYDGDGRADLAVFRPAAGEWWIERSRDSSVYAFQFGAGTDRAVG